MASLDILDPFTHVRPGPFMAKYEDWILFTLLLFFFWAVVGIALKRRFQESRHLRFLVTTTAMLLAVSTYYSVYNGWLHLSLQGFGIFGAVMLLIVIFFIVFGLMRGYGMPLHTALPLGYSLFYISLWAVSPNILDTIGGVFPPLNLILLILFIVGVFKSLSAFLRHSGSPLDAAKHLSKNPMTTTDDAEIDNELQDEKREHKLLKGKTLRLTKRDINAIEDIDDLLLQMINLIRNKANTIDQEERAELTGALRKIADKENILKKGTQLIERHVNAYRSMHRKDIAELEQRLSLTKDRAKRETIREELIYQKRMLQALKFLEDSEPTIVQFSQSFNSLSCAAIQKLNGRYPNDALGYLEHARKDLLNTRQIYEKDDKTNGQ